MPPAASMEKQIFDLLITKLGTIGTPASSYRTSLNEAVHSNRPPGDSIPVPADGKISLYAHITGIDSIPGETTINRHAWRILISIWVAARTQETMLEGRADVMDVLLANEQAFTQVAQGQPTWWDDFTVQAEMQSAGIFIGNQDIHYEYSVSH